MSTDHYYLHKNGQQQGPYTHSQLQSMWRNGAITANDQYRQGESDEWKPISLIQNMLDEPAQPSTPADVSTSAQPAQAKKSETLGVLILLIPVIVAAVVIFGMFGMLPIALTSMDFVYAMIGTIILTGILMAIEASHLGMGERINGKATTGPVGWFVCSLLLWVVAYPAYLYSRRRFGARNYLASGIIIALAFMGTGLLVTDASIASSIGAFMVPDTDEVSRQVLSSIRDKWATEPELKAASIQRFTLLHKDGKQYEGLLEATIEGQKVQFSVEVTYDRNGILWRTTPVR